MTPIDRTTAPDDVFGPLLARVEAEEPVDIAADAAEEKVARAIHEHEYDPHEWPWDEQDEGEKEAFRGLARAALAAMSPAHETLREKVKAEVVELSKLAATYGGIVIDNIDDGIDENADGKASAYTAAAERLRRILGGSR